MPYLHGIMTSRLTSSYFSDFLAAGKYTACEMIVVAESCDRVESSADRQLRERVEEVQCKGRELGK